MTEPRRFSKEAIDRHTQVTAAPLAGWLLAHWRGYAWLACRDCGWWRANPREDLTEEFLAHEQTDEHKLYAD